MRKLPWAEDIDDVHLKLLCEKMDVTFLMPEDVLFAAGEQLHLVYFVARGRLERYDEHTGESLSEVETDMLGLVPALRQGMAVRSIRAVTFCDLQTIESEDFLELADAIPQVERIVSEAQDEVDRLEEEESEDDGEEEARPKDSHDGGDGSAGASPPRFDAVLDKLGVNKKSRSGARRAASVSADNLLELLLAASQQGKKRGGRSRKVLPRTVSGKQKAALAAFGSV